MGTWTTKTTRLIPLLGVVLLLQTPTAFSQSKQEHVHQMAHSVMPFTMDKTLHIFKMTELGGVQRVVTRAPDSQEQVQMIRQHLQHEAQRFQQGDYSDPASLHGETMPGLKELQARASEITIFYSDIPNGGEIRFETTDIRLLTDIHRWFGAQLSEHGADAKAE